MICGYFDVQTTSAIYSNTQDELTKFEVGKLARKNKRQVSDMQI